MKKLLVTGGSGLLGSNMAKMAVGQYEVFATYYTHPVTIKGVNFSRIDLTDEKQQEAIEKIKPDIIVHTAALTNVDYCEAHPQKAYQHNVVATKLLAQTAQRLGAYLVHISTDTVFDGFRGKYTEEDTPNPLNVYAKTKLQAERMVKEHCPKAAIIRTTIYGWNKINKESLAEWMIHKFENHEHFPGFKDIDFTPLLVNDLADIIFAIITLKYEGILHVGASEACSKLDFAYKIAEIFGYDTKYIQPIDSGELEMKEKRVPRPKRTTLDVTKARQILERLLPTVREGLIRMKKLKENGYVDELKREFV